MSDFQPPSRLLAELHTKNSCVPNERFLSDNRYKQDRELWAAARLGVALENLGISVGIALVRQQADEADFELSIGTGVLRFQLREVQKPERKRGDEYKKRKGGYTSVSRYEPQRGMQEGPEWIGNAVKSKARKRYALKPHLVLYANFEAEDLNADEMLAKCSAYRSDFPSLWVLQNHRLIQVWESDATRGWARGWTYFSDIWKP